MRCKPDVTVAGVVLATSTGALTALLLAAPTFALAGGNGACGLLTAAELQVVLGGGLSNLKGGGVAGRMGPATSADAAFCSGQTPNASVLLRLARKRAGASGSAAKGVAIAKQMGAQVDVQSFGPITCSTILPPKNLEQYGFNTTCAVDKGTQVAAVEVTAKSLKDYGADRQTAPAGREDGRPLLTLD